MPATSSRRSTARAKGEARVELDGSLVELPTYGNAQRLLARGEALRQFERGGSGQFGDGG